MNITNSIESRIYTIISSLERYNNSNNSNNCNNCNNKITIHCLGAESNECEDLNSIPILYSLLLNKLVNDYNIEVLSIYFIGPNLLGEHNEELQVVTLVNNKNIQLNLKRYCGLYHDYIQSEMLSSTSSSSLNSNNMLTIEEYISLNPIDLLVCFNAGLWGYTDWIPTLKLIYLLNISQVVITSYTFYEAEDDYDIIEQYCQYDEQFLSSLFFSSFSSSSSEISESIRTRKLKWNFEPEENIYKLNKHITKISAPVTSTDYYENNFWQSFSIVNNSE